MNNKGADQTARMRTLICAFVVRILNKTHFLMARLKYNLRLKENIFDVKCQSFISEMHKTKKLIKYTPVKPHFYYINVGFEGV